ncbi:MAG: phosphohydrolase [Frankiales bacterium]|nr:phosphohydrolase [Frankiales bacterium]
MTLPPPLTLADLTAVDDLVERAQLLVRAAHAGQVDKAGADYVAGHLTDVWRRAVAYGTDADEQAAALLHDVVEDTDVTDEDLWGCGFGDRTVLIVHLMTKRPPEGDDAYYARLRAYEPARRLKLDADVASNSDPGRLRLVEEPTRSRLVAKYAKAAAALAPDGGRGAGDRHG